MDAEQRDHDNEREIRLKTMLVMTGMDHLIAAMDEQREALSHSQLNGAEAEDAAQQAEATFLGLFHGLLDKFNAIEEKLRSIQTAHFALQHSCSSATEVAQVALKSYQRGNPYLSQIDNILTTHSEHDTTEAIINSANDMINVARRDTEHVLSALRSPSRTELKHQSHTKPDAEIIHNIDLTQPQLRHYASPALLGV